MKNKQNRKGTKKTGRIWLVVHIRCKKFWNNLQTCLAFFMPWFDPENVAVQITGFPSTLAHCVFRSFLLNCIHQITYLCATEEEWYSILDRAGRAGCLFSSEKYEKEACVLQTPAYHFFDWEFHKNICIFSKLQICLFLYLFLRRSRSCALAILELIMWS